MIAAGSRSSSLPHPMPILILSRTRPSLHWERISVSHSIATAASPTAAKEPDKYRRLIGAMSAPGLHGYQAHSRPQLLGRPDQAVTFRRSKNRDFLISKDHA